MDEPGRSWAFRVLTATTRSRSPPRLPLAGAVQNFQKILPDVSVVLFGKIKRFAGIEKSKQQFVVDGRHVDHAGAHALLGALRRRGESLMDAAAAADDDGGIVGALAQNVSFSELERIIGAVEDGAMPCA